MAKGLTLAIALLLAVVCLLNSADTPFRVKAESLGWQVDVYTQKQPNSGAGLGQPSDAFGPDDLVLLYANVTYNGASVQHVLVSFSVNGPPNPVDNITLSLVASSNDTGTAQTSFRIISPSENVETVAFGTWNVTASIENASDYLTFRVGWIVEITALDLNDGIDPPQGSPLGVQLSLVNIAMVSQYVTLSILIYDSLNNLVGSVHIENMTVYAGGTNFSAVVTIPMSAVPGIGNVNVSVYTLNGTPFSPGKSAPFEISLFGDLDRNGRVNMADIAIVSAAFGSYPEHPRWNAAADVNKDHVVDLRDIAMVAQRFGKT